MAKTRKDLAQEDVSGFSGFVRSKYDVPYVLCPFGRDSTILIKSAGEHKEK